MRSFRTNERGFTLTEVLVASAIFVIVVVAALLMYDRGNRSFKQGVEAGNLQQNTRVAFEKMLADLRMTGFDYDRDGIPNAGTQMQQPDEQIEFVGRSAITIRGNFNYDTATQPCTNDPTNPVQCDNGRERSYEPTSGEYPVVTTGNNEIVTYALVSNSSAANTDSVTFFADVARPRNSFGTPETQVTINNVDFSNANPPYTLYRFTLNDTGGVVRTPIAENIRSMTFDYFEDTSGTTALRDLANPPAVITSASLATSVGGLGQYDPSDAEAIIPQRNIRLKINSIRVTLIGMSEARDGAFNDAADTIAPNYRKFQLSSLVVPRNTGRRGVLEQEYRPPGAPQITSICYGYCGIPFVKWTPPPANSANGLPEQYAVHFDTVPGGAAGIEYVGNVTEAFLYLVPDPTQRYFFTVEAINSYGSAISASVPASAPGIDIRNATTPNPPTDLTATGSGSLPAQANKVIVSWTMPNSNASGSPSCTAGSPPGTTVPPGELGSWRIFRRAQYNGTWTLWGEMPAAATSGANAPVPNIYTGTATWTDTTVANCVLYEYKIRTFESKCANNASANRNGATWESVDSAVVQGQATSDATPAAPVSLVATGTCPDPVTNPTANCNIDLQWSVVTTDTATPTPNNLVINRYYLRRTRKLAGNAAYSKVFPDIEILPTTAGSNWTSTPGFVKYSDSIRFNDENSPVAGGNYYFEYYVYAQQCSSPYSAPSPQAKFPCTWSGGTVSAGITPAAGLIEGSGTQASPWLVDSPVSLVINTTVGVASFAASIAPTGGGASTSLGTVSGSPVSTATFAIPSMSTGDANLVTVVITDIGGCQVTRQYWLSEAASNCCLNPIDLDATLVTTDISTKAVTFRLKNLCSSTLTIKSVKVIWNTNYSNGNPSVQAYFPSALGQAVPTVSAGSSSTSSPVTFLKPAGATATLATDVAGTADDYNVRFVFSKTFGASPITGLCITYQQPGFLADQVCRIAPDSSSPCP